MPTLKVDTQRWPMWIFTNLVNLFSLRYRPDIVNVLTKRFLVSGFSISHYRQWKLGRQLGNLRNGLAFNHTWNLWDMLCSLSLERSRQPSNFPQIFERYADTGKSSYRLNNCILDEEVRLNTIQKNSAINLNPQFRPKMGRRMKDGPIMKERTRKPRSNKSLELKIFCRLGYKGQRNSRNSSDLKDKPR